MGLAMPGKCSAKPMTALGPGLRPTVRIDILNRSPPEPPPPGSEIRLLVTIADICSGLLVT